MPLQKKHRIIVLGIDGLEYSLVEKWNLKYIKQKAYCKTDLSDFSVVVTPPIWGAMLTGRLDEKIIELFQKRINRREEWWWRFGKKLPKFIKILYWKFIYSKIDTNPFDVTKDYVIKNQNSTIFDFFERPWNNGIPSYGRNVQSKEVRRITLESISNDANALLQYAKKEFIEDKKALYEALHKDYDLIFWYTPFLDRVGHRFFHKKLQMMMLYMEINNLVKDIKGIAKDAYLYIVSDHGMMLDQETKRGVHSNYGFFSSNTGELIKKPQDLYHLLKEKATKVIK